MKDRRIVARLLSRKQRQLVFERLESREVMAASVLDLPSNPGHRCGLDGHHGSFEPHGDFPPANAGGVGGGSSTALSATNPISSLPALNSLPGAIAQLVLDFDGNFLSTWGSKTNVATPAYDIDGDTTTFSDQELLNIREIWERVAEDFAPFRINVTTIDPGNLADKVVAKVAIGGSYADWYGSSAGGVAYVGGFYNSLSNVAFAFENDLGNGNPRYVAEAVSHESGHLFGLSHQALWNGTTLVSSYNQGDANWAPIMGVGYYSAVTTWSNGPTASGPTAYQDNMAIVAGTSNGFGYRANVNGSANNAASLGNSGLVNVRGVIARNSDEQWWWFNTNGGTASFSADVIATGANLDAVLELRDASGAVVFAANPSTSQSASLNVSLTAGSYYAVVRSTGVYGRVGQYTLTGSFVPGSVVDPPTAPEIGVTLDGSTIADGGSVAFGSTTVGTSVTRTITVKNEGNATLTLQAINAADLPAGFSLASNLGDTSLQAGETATFTVRLDATSAGSYSGVLRITSDDADEGVYDLNIAGTVNPAPVLTSTIIDNGGSGYSQTGSWTIVTGAGRDTDYAVSGKNQSTARWQANGLAPGSYQVAVTWVASANAATKAKFSWGNDAGTVGSANVNERNVPVGFTSDGSVWRVLGTVTVGPGQQSLWVSVSNAGSNGAVVADAVRFDPVAASAAQAEPRSDLMAALSLHVADQAMAGWARRR